MKGVLEWETMVPVWITWKHSTYAFRMTDAPDTAGIGGGWIKIPNTLMMVLPATVVGGACAVKYGNWVKMLCSGLVDASEVPGVNTPSSFESRSDTSG